MIYKGKRLNLWKIHIPIELVKGNDFWSVTIIKCKTWVNFGSKNSKAKLTKHEHPTKESAA